MKRRSFRLFVFAALLLAIVALTACANETEALEARIALLEDENAELKSTISSLDSDLVRSRNDLSRAQSELQQLIEEIEAAREAEELAATAHLRGPLAITYRGIPNTDMSWEYRADLELGIRVDLSEFEENVEIVWSSTNEDIFTVVADEDGLTAKVTPKTAGSAELVVRVGGEETRSWIRITFR